MFAPKSEVNDTDNEAALVIAALRSRAPVIDIALRAAELPTVSPVPLPKTNVPVPRLAVKFLAPPELLTVPLKVRLLSVVVNIGEVVNKALPEYVCVPVVVTEAPTLVVPETLNILTPEIAPLITESPVIARE